MLSVSEASVVVSTALSVVSVATTSVPAFPCTAGKYAPGSAIFGSADYAATIAAMREAIQLASGDIV